MKSVIALLVVLSFISAYVAAFPDKEKAATKIVIDDKQSKNFLSIVGLDERRSKRSASNPYKCYRHLYEECCIEGCSTEEVQEFSHCAHGKGMTAYEWKRDNC